MANKLKALYKTDLDGLVATLSKLVAISQDSEHLSQDEKNLALNYLVQSIHLHQNPKIESTKDFNSIFSGFFDDAFPEKLTNKDFPPGLVKELVKTYQKEREISRDEAIEKLALATGKKPESLKNYMYRDRKR